MARTINAPAETTAYTQLRRSNESNQVLTDALSIVENHQPFRADSEVQHLIPDVTAQGRIDGKNVADRVMKLAYADPPYIGQAKRHYRCAEVDHEALIHRLKTEFPDGWALSCTSISLRQLLRMCPETIRVMAWAKPWASFRPNVNPAYAWEPILLYGGRRRGRGLPTIRDWVSANATRGRGVPGAKPQEFCFWLFQVLGLKPDDEFHDLFYGSGAVSIAWEQYRRQYTLWSPERVNGHSSGISRPPTLFTTLTTKHSESNLKPKSTDVMGIVSTIQIDPEFRSLIPPLSNEERAGLQESLRREGCRDALVIWNGRILDGHYRHEICVELGIPFRTVEAKLNTREEAKAWVIQNQFARRNLTPFQRAELALQLEPLLAQKAKEKQREAGGAVVQKSAEPPVQTRAAIAKIANVSHDTIRKAKVLAEKAPEDVKEKLRGGETTIHHEYQLIQTPKPKPPKPLETKHEIIDIKPTSISDIGASDATPQALTCDHPGCGEEAFRTWTVSRCAMHVDWDDGIAGKKNEEWTEYQRHLAALNQLLPRIPPHRLDAANNAALKLIDHLTRIPNHGSIYGKAFLEMFK